MGKAIKIQAGNTIGKWKILNDVVRDSNKGNKWRCRCDCGTERYVLERSLKYGGSKSCGCDRVKKCNEKISHQLDGKVFGELTVLHKAENQKNYGGIWWTTKCSCGALYDVPGSLLVTRKRVHCTGSSHERKYTYTDIRGQKFGFLTAVCPTEKRDNKGNVIWVCRCDCGNMLEISYNSLAYTPRISCGCKKRAHEQKLHTFLTHIDGTSLEQCRSKKIPTDNTTGVKGVYFVKGKWLAKIVFKRKQYDLGRYEHFEDAVNARREAEKTIFDGTVFYYKQWREKAEKNKEWAKTHPFRIEVCKNKSGELELVVL